MGALAGAMVVAFAADTPFDIATLAADNVAEIHVLQWVQVVASLFTFIVPALLYAKINSGNVLTFMQLRTCPRAMFFVLCTIFILAIMPALDIVVAWNERLVLPDSFAGVERYLRAAEDEARHIMDLLLFDTSPAGLIVAIVVVGLLPALGEELLFRGVLQRFLLAHLRRPATAIILSAVIFSAVHLQFYGFVPRVILGVILGYLVYRTGSLWTSIFAHFINNVAAVLSNAFCPNATAPQNVISHVILIVVSLIVAIVVGKIMWSKFKIADQP